jgi:hypothetical protein
MKSSKCHPCKRRSSQEVTLVEEDLAVEEAGDTLVVAIDLTGGIRSCCNLNGHFRELCCV